LMVENPKWLFPFRSLKAKGERIDDCAKRMAGWS
jgi:hypothetical protein